MRKYIYLNPRRGGLAIGASLLLALSQHSFGATIGYNFIGMGSAGGINMGHVYSPTGDLTVTAWGSINENDTVTPFFDGVSGMPDCSDTKDNGSCLNTIYLKDEGAERGSGLGVQEPPEPTVGGSSGISGKGREKNEQVVFDFTASLATSVNVGLTGIDFDSDSPILYVDLGASFLTFNSAAIQAACSPVVDFACTLSFAGLTGLDGLSIERFALRETGDEIKVGAFAAETSVVPLPAAAWLFGSGLLGMIVIARRKKAA